FFTLRQGRREVAMNNAGDRLASGGNMMGMDGAQGRGAPGFKRRAALSVLGALLGTTMGAPLAAAQERGVDPAPSAGVDEIIVTAEKGPQSVQDAAASVTAIGQDTMERFSIESFDDYATLVPGLSNSFVTQQRGIQVVGLRGVQSLNGTFIGGQNTVGFYLDN